MSNEAQRTIIIVDDEAAHRALIRRALQRVSVPHQTVEFETLTAAQRGLLNGGSDIALLIVDLNLAGESGLVLVKELRVNNRWHELPVLVLSTSALEHDVEQSYQAGANCFVTKASDPTQFRADVRAAVEFLLRFAPS